MAQYQEVPVVKATPVYLNLSSYSPIPDRFTKISLCCCAFSCSDCNFSSCWGCKSVTQCCCCEEVGYTCKCVESDHTCFICEQGALECVSCSSACKCYRQCCCFEILCGCPLDQAFVDTGSVNTNKPTHDGAVKGDDIMICQALCCTIDSLFCKFPECLGCYSKRVLCCIESEFVATKPMCCNKELEKKTLCCICLSGQCSMVHCKTCCKGESQFCCLDSRFAMPCDDEVPCVFTLLPCCVCCANYSFACGCCQTVGAIQAKKSEGRVQPR